MKTHSFTVNLTGPQAKFLKTLAAEFRADPGDMLAALALGSVNGLVSGGEEIPLIHAALYEILVLKLVPLVDLPRNDHTSVGREYED